MAKPIKLQGSDGGIIETNDRTVKCSETIIEMLEIANVDDDGNAVIPIVNVKSEILGKVIEWAKHHENDPEPDEDEDEEEAKKKISPIPTWDAEFLQVDIQTLYALIAAANYLVIKGLFDITCQKVAIMIKGKTVEEMRIILNAPNDFIPEQ